MSNDTDNAIVPGSASTIEECTAYVENQNYEKVPAAMREQWLRRKIASSKASMDWAIATIVRDFPETADEFPQPSSAARKFSKLKLYAALSAAGLWDTLMAWLGEQTYEGMNALTAFNLANVLTDDHPLFTQWLAAAKDALGVDDATVDGILAASVAD